MQHAQEEIAAAWLGWLSGLLGRLHLGWFGLSAFAAVGHNVGGHRTAHIIILWQIDERLRQQASRRSFPLDYPRL